MVNKTLTETMSWEEITNKIVDECKDDSPAFRKWLKEQEQLGGIFFNSLLYSLCYNIQNTVNKMDRDYFLVITGKEGFGKSTLACQVASVLSKRFCLKSICYEPSQYINNLSETQKGDVLIPDEGNLFLLNREAMGQDNRYMLKLFALMRQRNVITIICVPNFFTLDSYVRLHRVDGLIRIHERGKFVFFNQEAIKQINENRNFAGQFRSGSYFMGYFNKQFPKLNDLDSEAYKINKKDNFNIFLDELKTYYNKENSSQKMIKIPQASKMLDVDKRTLIGYIKAGKIKGAKIGRLWYVDKESFEKGLEVGFSI